MNKLPNYLTILRILLAPLFLILFLAEQEFFKIIAIGVFTLAVITDYFDGYLARKLEADSEFGNFMDPLADKVLTFTGFISLSLLNPQIFPWVIFFLIGFRDVFITVLRTIAKKNGKPLVTSYTAKIKTAVQMIFIYIALISLASLSNSYLSGYTQAYLVDTDFLYWLYVSVMIFTLYTAVDYLNKNFHIFQKEPARVD